MSTDVGLGTTSFSPLLNEKARSSWEAPSTPDKRIPVLDRSKIPPELLKAAEGMEAMFIDYMMKVMRQTIPKSEMDLESPATSIYRGMLDSEYAQKAAKAGGIGLADQIIAYLEAQRYNQNKISHYSKTPRRYP